MEENNNTNKVKVTREEWLTRAVEMLDQQLFGGELGLAEHGYRITWGKCPGAKMTECIQPSDQEDITLDDFFPTTISVSYTSKDPVEMLAALALECIHAFFNIKGTGNKRFKFLAHKYGFDDPFTAPHPTSTTKSILMGIYNDLKTKYGSWNDIAKPVVFSKKAKPKAAKNTLTLFCDNCGMEFKVNKKKFEKHGSKPPICGCGHMMAVDLTDETGSVDDSQNETQAANEAVQSE